MQNFKFLIILILVCLNSIVATGDNVSRGFVISNSGDTIAGRVLNINQNSIYSTCTFKTDKGSKEYKPNEIFGFGINSQFFTSQVVDSSFVEVLMEGTISLYKKDEFFLVTKNGELFTLQSEEKKVTTGTSSVLIENNKWKGALAFLISDCLSNAQRRTSNMAFGEKQIMKVVRQYNQCQGEPIKEYKENEKWSTFNFGLYGGYTFSSVRLKPQFYSGGDIPESISGVNPGVGLVFEFSTPRISKNVSLQFEPYYAANKLVSSYYEKIKMYQYCHTYTVDLKTLTLPISFKQSIVNGGVDFYYQIGVLVDYQLSKDTSKKTKFTDGYEIFEREKEEIFEINSVQPGLMLGLGVMKNLENFGLGLSLRYANNFYLSPQKMVYTYNDKFSINLIIMKR